MSHFVDQSKSFVDKTIDSKSHWNKEINDNGIDNGSMQVDGKRPLDDSSKRIPILKGLSVFSTTFGARDRILSERLLPSSHPADQNE